MKQSLIALAVASIFTSASAFADSSNVNIYGNANASFDVTDNGEVRTQQVSSNNSLIGLKGSERLNGDTSVVWQVEALLSIDGSSPNDNEQDGKANTWASGDSFVGLAGDSWGMVILGRHDTPYKMANRDYDLFADTIADNRSLMGMTAAGVNHNARLNNVVAYISPEMEGFKIAAAYSAAAENNTNSGQTKANAYSLAALYENKDIGLNLSAAYQTVKFGSTDSTGLDISDVTIPGVAGSKATAWSLGGSYEIAGFTVAAEYEKLGSSGNLLGDALDQTDWTIGGKYAFTSNDAVKVAYTRKGNANSVSDTSADLIYVGYDHNLSKRTTVYALYTRLSNDNAAGYSLGYSDATSGFAQAGVDANGNFENASAFSIGLKHSF